MPVTPQFDWEQSLLDVTVSVTVKGFKAEAIDVFISDLYVKVNAAPTYLLSLDLLKPIIVGKSSFRIEGSTVKITLPKEVEEEWETLVVGKEEGKEVLKERRAGALERAEAHYNQKLTTREQQKSVEKKRLLHEQWDIEKKQRLEILNKVKKEKEEEQKKLYEWEQQEAAKIATQKAKSIASPGDVSFIGTPSVRNVGETMNVSVDFTPKSLAAPSRSRGDEDYYRKSRYRPISVEDSPMFWKQKADKAYRAQDFHSAADFYTESIKRDGCFLSCVSNRAACHVQLHEYKKAVEDCDLALTLLSNTPASETTQDRYKFMMMKLHARRGAARCWDGQYALGVEDLRIAAAYRTEDDTNSNDILADLNSVEDYMKRKGIVETRDPNAEILQEASNCYYKGLYSAAVEKYEQLLGLNPYDVKSRNNMAAALLQLGENERALEECMKVIQFCSEVAAALAEPGVHNSDVGADSDDEDIVGDEEIDEMVAKRRAAARKIGEKSGHVYLLLKAYVRAAAALCGQRQYKKAYEFMELAVRITPYDDDLRDDANRILEKLKMDTLIGKTTTS